MENYHMSSQNTIFIGTVGPTQAELHPREDYHMATTKLSICQLLGPRETKIRPQKFFL